MELPSNDYGTKFTLCFISDDYKTAASLFDTVRCWFQHLAMLFITEDAFFQQQIDLVADVGKTIYLFNMAVLSDEQLDLILQSKISDTSIFYDSSKSYENSYRLMLRGCTKLWHTGTDFSRLAALIHSLPTTATSTHESIRRYCSDHLSDPLSLEHLSVVFHISQNYLSTLFKQHYGIPVMAYVQNCRLEHAKQMLLNSNATIQEISRQCGYTSAKYFNVVFKKHVGMTPGHYRRFYSYNKLYSKS